ncbi:MAG: glutaminyl-peptide cyclotransferase [Pyrinomonadaceae bacterium]
MRRFHIAFLLILILAVGFRGQELPTPFQKGKQLLYEGKTREALEVLLTVPWSSPDIMSARKLISETCTRIELANPKVNPPLRIEIVEIVATLPHDSTCFTQGLAFDKGTFWESCGLKGKSSVRRVDAKTGKLLAEQKLDKKYYGEGLTQINGKIFVLTWLEGTGLVFDSQLNQLERTFAFQGEGWGIAHDGTDLICSNGTNEIRFLDPKTGSIKKTIKVFNGDLPIMNINELEYVNGELLANILFTERIARIDATSGKLIGWILAEGLLPTDLYNKANVLNGIAYDSVRGQLYLTGKNWPNVFIVNLKPLMASKST